MSHFLERQIAQGEHLKQDFKFRIDDSRKIAKTLSAFANTAGGRLLIGVKDNGKITGANVEEEYYMIEAGANMYAKPEIPFETKVWKVNGKSVLEIYVPFSEKRPHFSQDSNGKWIAYIRQDDNTIPASAAHLEMWRIDSPATGRPAKFEFEESSILDLLHEGPLTVTQISKQTGIHRRRIISGLAHLMKWNIIDARQHGEYFTFSILPD